MWLQVETELRGASMELFDDAIAVLLLVVIRAWVAVIHAVTHGVIEQHGNLASGGSDGLGVTDTASKAPIKCAERGVATAYGHCCKPESYGNPTTGFAGMRR
ncbi:hypothetical protein [Massilia putida]|uniref:hypothetical protein n=1 Tax=Massilia putida TaxID=1141883 RepID=UPI0015D14171|nr:hypothetical protein [Massilia putida]